MDEGGGSTLADDSDAHLDATLVGDPGWIDSPIPDDTIPAAPSSVAADGGVSTVNVAWSAVGASDLAGYNIYRSSASPVATDGEPLNGPVPITATAYVDDHVVAGTAYHYVVTAVDRYANESAASGEASATPGGDTGTDPPLAPPPVPPLVDVNLALAADAPPQGRHRIDPGAAMTATLAMTTPTDIATAGLVLAIPEGWSVTDPDGGSFDAGRARLTWDLEGLTAGSTTNRTVRFVAPTASPVDGGPVVESTFEASLRQAGGVSAGPQLTVLVAPRVVVEHWVVGQLDDVSHRATYLAGDSPITDGQRFEVVRVRFQIRNADDLQAGVVPRLEYRRAAGGEFRPVPALEKSDGVPFYVARESIPATGMVSGSELGPEREVIDASSLVVDDRDGTDEVGVAGQHSMGDNPATSVAMPPRSYTEVEFSVRVTVDADYVAAYQFRITDDGSPIPSAAVADVQMGERPKVDESRMRDGLPVGGPSGDAPAGTAATVAYRLLPPDVARGRVDAAAATGPETPRYELATSVSPVRRSAGALGAPLDSTHGPYSLTSDACASCHATHTAQGAYLVAKAAPLSSTCLTCHRSDGSASAFDVQAQYTDAGVPQNDPATRTSTAMTPSPRTAGTRSPVTTSSAASATATASAPTATARTRPTRPPASRRQRDGPPRGVSVGSRRVRCQQHHAGRRAQLHVPRWQAQPDHPRVRALLQVPLGLHEAPLEYRLPAVAAGA